MSQLVTWSDDLATGVTDVDAHHRTLVGLLNELHETVHRRRGVAACRAAVEKLHRCVLSHLEVEAKLMHLAGHDADPGSRDEYREVERLLDGMLARMDAENSHITFHCMHELKSWLLAHMRRVRSDAVAPDRGAAESARTFGDGALLPRR